MSVSWPTYQAIAEALNLVWGELTVEQTREVPEEVREVCQAVHEMVCHEPLPWFHPHHFSDPSPSGNAPDERLVNHYGYCTLRPDHDGACAPRPDPSGNDSSQPTPPVYGSVTE